MSLLVNVNGGGNVKIDYFVVVWDVFTYAMLFWCENPIKTTVKDSFYHKNALLWASHWSTLAYMDSMKCREHVVCRSSD